MMVIGVSRRFPGGMHKHRAVAVPAVEPQAGRDAQKKDTHRLKEAWRGFVDWVGRCWHLARWDRPDEIRMIHEERPTTDVVGAGRQHLGEARREHVDDVDQEWGLRRCSVLEIDVTRQTAAEVEQSPVCRALLSLLDEGV